LGEHAVHLAPGTRGKKLGVAEITLRAGAEGFEVEGAQADLLARTVELRERVLRAQERVSAARDERAKLRAEQRLSRLEKELSESEARLAPPEDAGPVVRHVIANRLEALSEDVDDDPSVMAKVEATKEIIESVSKMRAPRVKDVVSRAFVGDRACLSCHAEQHGQWKSTPHAYAWATLVREKRSQDLDCWSCHVTGAHHPEGPKSPSEVGLLRNVGCESCHGPGQKHVISPAKSNIVRRPSIDSCENCHDGIKDEGRFDPETYMSKVTH